MVILIQVQSNQLSSKLSLLTKPVRKINVIQNQLWIPTQLERTIRILVRKVVHLVVKSVLVILFPKLVEIVNLLPFTFLSINSEELPVEYRVVHLERKIASHWTQLVY